MIEEIKDGEQLLAIIIRGDYKAEGIEFFTPGHFSQQLGYMNRKKDHVIAPHVHNEVSRTVAYTKEVLIIKRGLVRVDFYNDCKAYLHSRILCGGDIVLLAYGGHGFKMLEDSEIFEVKQGPYAGDGDKTRFDSVEDSAVIVLNEVNR